MISWRLASSKISRPGTGRRLSARQPAEHRADGQAEAAQITFGENVSGHDFSRGENILERLSALLDNARAIVHFNAHVSEGNTWAQREGVERWLVDGHGPVAFWRSEPARAVSVQLIHAQIS